MEVLVRPAGCVFDNPVIDGCAAMTFSCIMPGPPVASEEKGPNVMVGVQLAACKHVLIFP